MGIFERKKKGIAAKQSELVPSKEGIERDFKPEDLCIPIYLNQQVVFDLLATLEDGFSSMRTIRTSGSEAQSEASELGGSIGISNVFALLGVSFGAKRANSGGRRSEEEISQDKVHTPGSLFAKLRRILIEKSLLRRIETLEEVEGLTATQFVEFRAILRKNPLMDAIQAMKRLLAMAAQFTATQERPAKKARDAQGKPPADDSRMLKNQFDAMLEDLEKPGSLELIGEMLGIPDAKAVISAKPTFFSDADASEIIDGEFLVVGKVVRVVPSGSEGSINLLRKTALGLFKPKIFEDLRVALDDAGEYGLRMITLVTEIKGPAIQVFPIAIFT